jgi:hypothetical protein
MTAPKEKGWEQEFDKQFCVEDVVEDDGTPLGRQINIEFDTKDLKAFIERTLSQQKRETQNNIGNLRQWLNEKPADLLVTNEMIETWLFPKP